MQCVCERRERERKGNYGSIKIDNARCSSSLCPSFPTYLAYLYLRTSIPLLLLLLMLLMQSRFLPLLGSGIWRKLFDYII